jgi:hypothetical protein
MRDLKLTKKGEQLGPAVNGLIIGALCLIVLIAVFVLLWPVDKGTDAQKASSSYFDLFMEEIEKADRGDTGEFLMWQGPGAGKIDDDVFFVYFDDKYKFQIGEMTFVSFNNKNSFCVCSWEDDEPECRDRNCGELILPIKFNDEEGQFIMSVGNKMEISRGEDFYEAYGSEIEEE